LACRDGLVDVVSALLEFPQIDGTCTINGITPLTATIKSKASTQTKIQIMDILFKKFGDDFAKYGKSPLCLAAKNCDVDVVLFLLKEGRLSNVKMDGKYPWDFAKGLTSSNEKILLEKKDLIEKNCWNRNGTYFFKKKEPNSKKSKKRNTRKKRKEDGNETPKPKKLKADKSEIDENSLDHSNDSLFQDNNDFLSSQNFENFTVAHFLQQLKLDEFIPIFAEQKINDMEDVFLLTESQLIEMKMKIGPRNKFLKLIGKKND